jgi:hypothetical protein
MLRKDKETFETELRNSEDVLQPLMIEETRASATRRVFLRGLAALLALVPIPVLSAWQSDIEIEDDLDDYVYVPPVEYLEVGECEDMLGGPAIEAGWYLHPPCMIGCCRSEGPFPTKEAALEADRIRWKQIAERARSQTTAEADQLEGLVF